MKAAFLLATAAVLMTGCAGNISIHPLYTKGDIAADVALDGVWMCETDVFTVKKAESGYVVTDPEGEKYAVQPVRAGEHRFLDIAPLKVPDLAIAGHLFAKIVVRGDEISIAFLDTDWIRDKAKADGLALAPIDKTQVLFTAPTAELRRFVERYAADPAAFADAATCRCLKR